MKKFKRNFVFVCLLFSCSLLMSSSTSSPPQILTPLKNIVISEGKPLIFKCKVSCAVEFECYLNGLIVLNSEEFEVAFSDGIALLRIMDTRVENSGIVEFRFANINGSKSTRARLTVIKSE